MNKDHTLKSRHSRVHPKIRQIERKARVKHPTEEAGVSWITKMLVCDQNTLGQLLVNEDVDNCGELRGV